MKIKLSCIIIVLFINTQVFSQNLLADIRKYDRCKIEKQTIKKSRKFLKADKNRHLSVFIYFVVSLSDSLSQKIGTYANYHEYLAHAHITSSGKKDGAVDDFFEKFKLLNKNEYHCYVYDDSLNIITMRLKEHVFPYSNTTPDMKYIEYITRINPEYTFEYLFCLLPYPVYFCYKDGEIIIVHLSDDKKGIVSSPLSEFKDWKWLDKWW